MISSIFDKTKPINFILIVLFFSLQYGLASFFLYDAKFELGFLWMFLARLFGFSLFLFFINFMVKKNQLNTSHTFSVYFFVLLMGIYSDTMFNNTMLISFLLVLMSMRRVLSMRSMTSIKNKIFDASLWILIASYFNSWAAWFLLIVGVAIYFYQFENIRNWLVILTAVFSYGILLMAYLGIDDFFDFVQTHYRYSFSGVHFDSSWNRIAFLFLVVVSLLSSLYNYRNITRSIVGRLISYRLLMMTLLIAVGIAAFSGNKNADHLLYSLFPISVLLGSAVEMQKQKFKRELLLLLFFVLPYVALILRANQLI